jgi:glycosyltransferase involved in cell wall biosynthesis
VIVADGASKDETIDVLRARAARHPELRWQSEPDHGPADAVNKGLQLARGAILAIQSADDVYLPGAFETAMRVFNDDPECGLLIGNCQGIRADGSRIYTSELPPFSWEAYFGMALRIPQSSIFFRGSIARAAGGWNAKYFGCDLDYWLRLMLRGKTVAIPDVLSGWRIYGKEQRTFSGQNHKIWQGYWQMIDDCEELRRAPARLRRLARASRHIMALHHYAGSAWAMRGHALMALFLHPTFWRYQSPDALKKLVPGRRFLTRAKATRP